MAGCDAGSCRVAVVRTYRELRDRGASDRWAFGSAMIVFRNHHPEVASAEVPYRIAGWIEEAIADDQNRWAPASSMPS